MNITDVKTDIKNKEIKSYYIFAGDEIEIQRIYINKIAEVLNYEVKRVDYIADVWSEIISPTLFGEPCVYVVRDDKDLLNDTTLQEQIEHNRLNGNIIINLVTTLDKRTKWYKSNSDKIVLFERLSTEILIKYCQREITLNNANCERFITICENDYSRMLLEIDKIKRFKQWLTDYALDNVPADEYLKLPNDDYDSVFEYFVKEGAIAIPPKDAVFDLVDAILKRDVQNTYYLLDQCRQINEANMVILSVLYNNAKQVLQVQACHSSDVVKSTGLTAYQVKCAKAKCGKYGIGELVDMLMLIQKIQKGIITGQIEDEMSVDYLLVKVL